MKIKVIRVKDNSLVDATIVDAFKQKLALPSKADDWRFDFKKHAKQKEFKTFVLVCDETPILIEGCLIFKMKDKMEPYMSFIEIAPHNKVSERKYENIAACLIAFACRLSFIHGTGDFKGWLAFDVLEENKDDEIKLMAVYSKKYNAKRFGKTTMLLSPEDGENLINTFLK